MDSRLSLLVDSNLFLHPLLQIFLSSSLLDFTVLLDRSFFQDKLKIKIHFNVTLGGIKATISFTTPTEERVVSKSFLMGYKEGSRRATEVIIQPDDCDYNLSRTVQNALETSE